MRIDHVVVAAATLEEGAAAVEAALGLSLPAAIGRHPLMGTCNRLLSLGGTEYLEVIAVDPAAPPPRRPRWFGLDTFAGRPRIVAWVCAVDSLADEALPGAGLPLSLARGPFRWRMAVPETGELPFAGLQPAQIEWNGDHPALTLPASGCRLARLTLATPEAVVLRRRLGGLADPRVRVVRGLRPGISAEFDTAAGRRRL